MNKADWMTSVSAIVGVAGIGLGWWWADSAAAIVIATSILKDGSTNLRAAVAGLIDARPTTFDNKRTHPLLFDVDDYLNGLPWVHAAGVRMRDEGHVFQVEGFVVPKNSELATPERLDAVRQHLFTLDWKIRDVTLSPVLELPTVLSSHTART